MEEKNRENQENKEKNTVVDETIEEEYKLGEEYYDKLLEEAKEEKNDNN